MCILRAILWASVLGLWSGCQQTSEGSTNNTDTSDTGTEEAADGDADSDSDTDSDTDTDTDSDSDSDSDNDTDTDTDGDTDTDTDGDTDTDTDTDGDGDTDTDTDTDAYPEETPVCENLLVKSIETSESIGNIKIRDGISYGRLLMDLSDPENPAEIYTFNEEGAHMTLDADYVYTLSLTSEPGLSVWDFSVPTAPTTVGSVPVLPPQDLSDLTDDAQMETETFNNMEVQDGYAYVAYSHTWMYCPINCADGTVNQSMVWLQVYDVSNPAAPEMVAVLPDPSGVGANDISGYPTVALQGEYAYMTAVDHIWVIDISTPAAPSTAASLELTPEKHFKDSKIEGDILYVAEGIDTLFTIDISTPTDPRLLGRVDLSLNLLSEISVRDGFIFATGQTRTLTIVNAQDPEAPFVLCNSEETDRSESVGVSGNHAFVSLLFGSSLQVMDVSITVN